jgi:hypothetical protein
MIKVKNNETGKIKNFKTLTEAINWQEYLVFVLGIDAEIL